mgnify:CR=1 FL=1
MKSVKVKRAASFAFFVLLVLNLFLLPVGAAESGKLLVTSASGKQGETVTVDVSIGNNPGLITFRVAVSYDSELELVSASDSGLLHGWTTPSPTISSPYTLRWADSLATTNNTANGKIATLTFKIKDTAAPGSKQITVSFVESRDANGGKNTFADAMAQITVTCKNHTFGSCTKLNDSQHQRTCSACGYVEKTAHKWDGGKVIKAATCKEAGSREFSCTACKATKTESIAKTNTHTFGSYSVTKQPTCTAAGTQTRACSVCGKTETQSVPATGHSMGGWTQTKEPTCTEKGEETRSCSKCGHSETKAIAALGHSFSSPKVTKEPTCTESGTEEGVCSRCGKTTTNTIKAKGHKFGAWTAAKAATCTEGGTQERKCSACGATESRTTKALGHDFENPTVVKEATISSTGLKEGKCKRCGETTSEVIPCTTKDDATGAIFEADAGVFQEGTTLSVEEIGRDNPSYASAENVLKDTCKDFKLYDVSASQNGADVQPNGELTVTLPIPDGFGTDVALYLLSSDGTAEPIEATVSADGKTLTAKLTKLGELAIGKLGNSSAGSNDPTDSTDSSVSDDVPAQGSSLVWIIVAIAAVVVIGGAIVLIVVLKKKKAQ